MSSGYEQSPEYGEQEPTWRGVAIALVVIAVMAALMLVLL